MNNNTFEDRESFVIAQKLAARARTAARKRERQAMEARVQNSNIFALGPKGPAMTNLEMQVSHLSSKRAGPRPANNSMNESQTRSTQTRLPPNRGSNVSAKTTGYTPYSSIPRSPPWSSTRKAVGGVPRKEFSSLPPRYNGGYPSDPPQSSQNRAEINRKRADILPFKSSPSGHLNWTLLDDNDEPTQGTSISSRRPIGNDSVSGPRHRVAAHAGPSRHRTNLVRTGSSSPEDRPFQYSMLPGLRLHKFSLRKTSGSNPHTQLATKAARKTKASAHIGTYSIDSDSEPEGDVISISSDIVPEHAPGSDDDSVEVVSPPLSPVPSLKCVDFATSCHENLQISMQAAMAPTNHMFKSHCLPFLRRNVKRGFLLKCALMGCEIPDASEDVSLTLIYRAGPPLQAPDLEIHTRGWHCPICALYGRFKTRDILLQHLEWDHPSVSTHWDNPKTSSWILTLTLAPPVTGATPSPSDEEIDVPQDDDALERPMEGLTPRDDQVIPRDIQTEQPVMTGPPAAQLNDLPRDEPSLRDTSLPSLDPDSSIRPTTPPLSLSPEDHVIIKPEPMDISPPLSPTPPRPPPAQSVRPEPRPVTTSRPPRPDNLPAEYPDPPPPSDPLGPAAVYPYLPAESLYGGPAMKYSCRIGGPRLFDLLGTLPMEPFGAMSWYIIDREEEIFEANDMSDEYKVIHALWARWIFLNRNMFIQDYAAGVTAFVDQYWRMIHLAAGWDALRHLLLVLFKTRYLNGAQVAKVLKHYEEKTGMEFWSPVLVDTSKSKSRRKAR